VAVTTPRKTKRAAAFYIVLAGLQRSVSLLILPFVTHAMTPADYGAASMLSVSAILLTSIIASPLIQLIIRAAARNDEDGPALLRLCGLYCYLLVPLTGAVAAAATALWVPEFLGVSGTLWALELLAIGFQPATSTYALIVSQAREDLHRFAWLSATSVIVAATSKLFLVVVLHMGVFGWVLSDLISAVFSACMAAALVRPPRARIHSQHARYALKFTLPLIPHSASLWALMALSRPALAAVSTLEQVGLLSFGLNLAAVAGLILSEVNRAALPRYSREVTPAPTQETLGPARWQIIAAFAVPAAIGSGVALIGPAIFAEAYWPSFHLTGILLIGQAALGLYFIPMNYLTQTAGITRLSAIASGAGAAILAACVLALGRTYGAVAVGYATSAAYLAMAAAALLLTAVERVEIDWGSWGKHCPEFAVASATLGLGVGALALPTDSHGSRLMAVASLGLLAVFALIVSRREKAGA
jgi:O-antigen/teichoic acid export membrane protein